MTAATPDLGARRRRGEGKRRGRWGVPARGGAGRGEGEAGAAMVELFIGQPCWFRR
jgi:hypothetical protein